MDCCIRLFCHRLTRKQRKIVTTTAFLLFLTACLHAILASLSGLGELGRAWGKDENRICPAA